MNKLESGIQNLCGIRTSISHTCLNLAHVPNTLLGSIDKWVKKVQEDFAPHLLDEKREERNSMIKHYKLILTGLATLTSQIQKFVSYSDKNKGTVSADHCPEVEKMHGELPTLDENAEAIGAMITDSERFIHLLMSEKRHYPQIS